MTVLSLPDDLLHSIFSYLTDDQDLSNVSKISSRWKNIADVVLLWKNKIMLDSFRLRKSLRWSSLPIKSRKPSDRYGCAMFNKGDHLYVFGGVTKSLTFFNDLWQFDIKKNLWNRMFGSGIIPIVRAFSCCGYDNDTLYFFGGCNGINLNRNWINVIDSFKLDKKVWHSYQPKGVEPKQFVGQSYCNLKRVDGSQSTIFLFGGYSQFDSKCSQEEYFITLKTGECSILKLRSDKKPFNRFGSAITALDQFRILIVGGFTSMNQGEIFLNDVWLLTCVTPQEDCIHQTIWEWTEIDVQSSKSPFCTSQHFYNSIAFNLYDSLSSDTALKDGRNEKVDPETIVIISIAEDKQKKQFCNIRSEKIDLFLQFLFRRAKNNKELKVLAENYSDYVLDTSSALMESKDEQKHYRMTVHSLNLYSDNKCTWNEPIHSFIEDPVWAPPAKLCFSAVLTMKGIYLFGGVPLNTDLIDIEAQYRQFEKINIIKNYFHKAFELFERSKSDSEVKAFLTELFISNKGSTFSELLLLRPKLFP